MLLILNATFVLFSTEPREQLDVSPCTTVYIKFQGHISKALNGNGSGHDSDGTYMSSLSGSGGRSGGGGSVVVGRVGVGSISDLLSPVEAAAERIERELSKDLFGDTTGMRILLLTCSCCADHVLLRLD